MIEKNLLVIFGPTASGKTSLSIEIAKKFNGEIISADSMQIYKGMEISTAQPTIKERENIPHHMIGFLHPTINFSVGEYQKHVRKIIEDIQKRGKLPILCGGTGLYIDSIIYNMDFAKTSGHDEIRQRYTKYYEKYGALKLHELLHEISPETAQRIHPNNVKRVIRALEINVLTGENINEYYNNNMKRLHYSNTLILGITWPREELYERINKRVDIMLEMGLINEIKNLIESGIAKDNTAYKALGVKELKPYFDEEAQLDDCINKIKQKTRNFAKRQITWFKRYNDATWLEYYNNMDIFQNNIKLFNILENNYFYLTNN